MSDSLKITVSISPYLLGLGKIHLNVLNGAGETLVDENLDKSLVISGDFIDIIQPIRRILHRLRAKSSYNFEEENPSIEFNIAFDEKNDVVRHIGISDLSEIQGEFHLGNISFEKVSIYNTHYKNDISIDEIHVFGICDSIEIRNLHVHKLQSSSPSNKIYIGYSQIDDWSHATLTTEIEKHGFWSFEKTIFGKVEFVSNKPKGDTFSQIDFYQCEFQERLLLRKISIETSLKGVKNVTKGLYFNDCTFSNNGFLRILQSNIMLFQCIETINQLIELSDSEIEKAFIYQSNLDKLSIIGGKSPGFYNLQTKSNYSSGAPSSSELKELYRQLKYSHDSIGNKTEANKFFAKEMEYYRKSLLENFTWKTVFNLDIGQKTIICWYNQLTNNFGNSILRPLFWMLILIGVATLYKFLNCDGNFYWDKQVLANILPISGIGTFKSWHSLFYQIAWAALIYQFIVALRRVSQR